MRDRCIVCHKETEPGQTFCGDACRDFYFTNEDEVYAEYETRYQIH